MPTIVTDAHPIGAARVLVIERKGSV